MGRLISRISKGLFCLIMLLSPAHADETSPDPILGLWMNHVGTRVLDFHKCGDRICGRAVWALDNINEKYAIIKTDMKNPDPTKRDRLRCGLNMITGLKRVSDREYVEGTYYRFKTGKSYDMTAKVLKNGKMRVKGQVTRLWTRAKVIKPHCLPQLG